MSRILRSFSILGRIILLLSLLNLGTGEKTDSWHSEEDDYYLKARMRMVEKDLKERDITDPRVLNVMGRVPRHQFVDPGLRKKAYADHPLPIGEGQTISQPYIVALMTQLLNPQPGDRILEIGTGSGYQAAVLAELVDQVFSVEIREGLCQEARERLKKLGYKNVRVKCADGYFGWKEYAPFDGIIVTAAADHVPPPLLKQLKEEGVLLIPLGSTTYYQTLTRVRKKAGGGFEFEEKTGVVFVPLIGRVQKRIP